MDKKQEKWAIFWCELLDPIIFEEIEATECNQYLKQTAQKEICFPDGKIGKPSISRLRRKLNRYLQGGFDGLAKKPRSDRGKPRIVADEVMQKAIELKKEQPKRSPITINRFLYDMYGLTVPEATLYRHFKQANATRLKLGVIRKKVRKRWTKEHTHDSWVGDFEEGPYVLANNNAIPTYLSAFIDCHSRYIVDARYYYRQNLDVLIDTLLRSWAVHGSSIQLYVDNAKVYHSNGLKAACYRCKIKLIHRPKGEPETGGIIERFFQTVQEQFEAEVRAGDILSLAELNRGFSAWLAMSYHKSIHSEIHKTPEEKYKTGLTCIRQIDLNTALNSFMQKEGRTVHKTFSDVQLNKKFYLVDPKLRGDRVNVWYDPFAHMDKVQIHSLGGVYLGEGILHHRDADVSTLPEPTLGKPKNNLIDILVREHKKELAKETGGIDYRKVVNTRPWPFHEFAKMVADLMGKKAGLADLSSGELEALKKTYNQSTSINKNMLKKAFEKAFHKTVPYIVLELKLLIKNEKEKN